MIEKKQRGPRNKIKFVWKMQVVATRKDQEDAGKNHV